MEPLVATPPITRAAGSLPFPDLAPGTESREMDFDHIVVVMMENHSFDNLLGEMTLSNPNVKGLRFNAAGEAQDSNPTVKNGPSDVPAKRLEDTTQAKDITQSYEATADQIDEGRMDGFVSSEHGRAEAMGYYPPEVLPFSYSLAKAYTVANKWFCSTPGPTYPNRRFLLAGTAFGGTTSSPLEIAEAFLKPPPNGSICDVLSKHGISWANYSRDVPMTLVLPHVLLSHHGNHHRYPKFLDDCAAGTLPQVSFVDPKMGIFSAAGNAIKQIPASIKELLDRLDPGETDEDPDDMYYGERWAHEVVQAVTSGPAWKRTLLIYTFDKHGGYYDHVKPEKALAPDSIKPKEPAGNYELYGPRVPAVIVSPYAREGGFSDTLYDHTSILATIEHKWNLPALTLRDANANTVMDMLDMSQPPRNPEKLDAPVLGSQSGPVTPRRPVRLAAANAQTDPEPTPEGSKGMRDRFTKIAADPVERYERLLALSSPAPATLKTEALEGVIGKGEDDVTALSRHVAEHSNLSLAQATPVVKAALEKTKQEGKTETKDKAEAVSKATAGLSGGSANVELSDPVMLEPVYRVLFAAVMSGVFAACVACVAIIGSEAGTEESALIGLSVLGVLALIAVLVLVMGYKNVKISGAGPSAGGGGS